MTGPELIVTVLGVSLIVAGTVAFNFYLKNKVEIRKIESDDEETKTLLSHYQEQQTNDTKRFELLTTALKAQPILKKIESAAEPARDEVINAN